MLVYIYTSSYAGKFYVSKEIFTTPPVFQTAATKTPPGFASPKWSIFYFFVPRKLRHFPPPQKNKQVEWFGYSPEN